MRRSCAERPRDRRAGRGRRRRATSSSSGTRSSSAPTTARRASTAWRAAGAVRRRRRRARRPRRTGPGWSTAWTGSPRTARALARRLDGEPAVEVALFREGGRRVAARRRGAPLRARGPVADLDGDEPCSTSRTRSSAPGRRSRTRTPARCSSRRLRAGVRRPRRPAPRGRRQPRLARSGDSEVPVLTVGVDGEPASIIDVAPAALAHFGIARRRCARLAVRPEPDCRGRAAAARARHPRRARARRDGARAAGALRPAGGAATRLRRRGAADRLRRRRSRSRTWSRVIVELLGLGGDERVLDVGTGSGYQAAVLAELADEVVPSSGSRARRAGPGASARGGRLRRGRGPRRRRHARACPTGRRSTGSPSPPRRPAAERALRAARRPRAGSSSPSGGDGAAARARRPQPGGPAVLRSVPCRFVPLARRGGVRGVAPFRAHRGRAGGHGGSEGEGCCGPVRLNGIQLGRAVDLILDHAGGACSASTCSAGTGSTGSSRSRPPRRLPARSRFAPP